MVSPLGVVMSLIALPLAAFILALGYLKIVFSAVLPSAALLLGIPLSIAGLLGLLWMGSNPETRRIVLAWLGFAAVLLGVVIWPTFHPFRNLLSLVPILCIAGAFLFERLARQFDYRPALMIAVIILFAASLAWPSVRYVHTRIAHVDSRVRSVA